MSLRGSPLRVASVPTLPSTSSPFMKPAHGTGRGRVLAASIAANVVLVIVLLLWVGLEGMPLPTESRYMHFPLPTLAYAILQGSISRVYDRCPKQCMLWVPMPITMLLLHRIASEQSPESAILLTRLKGDVQVQLCCYSAWNSPDHFICTAADAMITSWPFVWPLRVPPSQALSSTSL